MSNSVGLLTISQAAARIGISRQTLLTWIQGDKIRVVRLASGRYRIPESEIARMLLPRTNSEWKIDASL